MGQTVRAAIIGSTGYGGVELIRLLMQHPEVAITSVVSSSSAGAPLAQGFPHLTNICTDTLDDVDVELLAAKADVVFTATPSGISRDLTPRLLDAGLKVIDISGDFRLTPGSLYPTWYGHEAPDEAYLQRAVYGLSEVYHQEVANADLIANPGCFPTATLLSLIPLVKGGFIDPSTLIIDGKSGASGAGRKMSQMLHYSELNENLQAYKVNKHQHIPEIEQYLSKTAGHEVVTTFTTHLVPMTRGILITSYASLVGSPSEQEIRDYYRSYYAGRSFVRIREAGQWPATKEVWGSNFCDIAISVDPRTNRITVLSTIDNVVKGAAGQAVQNLNIRMGWEETTGLAFTPVYP